MVDVIDFLAAIDDAENADNLWQTLCAQLQSLGVKSIFYRHIPLIAGEDFESQNVRVFGYPDIIIQHHRDGALYESDVIQERCFTQNNTCFWMNNDDFEHDSEPKKAFLTLLKPHGFTDSLITPVFAAFSRTGYFCLSFDKKKADISARTQHMCQVVCNYAHMKYAYLSTNTQPNIEVLSKRELEIIRWVARGKSNSVIGDIMGISRHTVDSYLRRIFAKLKATDRTTAALKALNMGLIIS